MLSVRSARADDGPAIAEIYAPYVRDSAISFELDPPDGAEMARRMRVGEPALPWLVATEGAADVLGFAYAGPFRSRPAYQWSVEVSVYVRGTAHGRGTGRALYDELLAELRRLGYVNAFAGIALPNGPSVALHERMGFARIGVFPDAGFKFDRWHDVGWWWLALVDGPPASPLAPLPWGD